MISMAVVVVVLISSVCLAWLVSSKGIPNDGWKGVDLFNEYDEKN
jgi:hypothetical protein